MKIIKTSSGLTKLGFKAGSVKYNVVENPKYMKFVCSKCHISGSLKDLQKVYKIQPNSMKGEIDHNVINFSNFKDFENSWKPYLIDDVLGLAYVVAKHRNHIQKITCVSYKNSSTEASLSWSCLSRYLKEDNKVLYTPKNKYVRHFIKKKQYTEAKSQLVKKYCIEIFSRGCECFRKVLWKSFRAICIIRKIF